MAALAELLRALDPARSRWRSGSSPAPRARAASASAGDRPTGDDVEPADEPSVEVLEVDRILTELAGTAGPGSQAARQALLTDLFSRATEPEVDFVRRLLTGELRQGALAGVMTDAVATAAEHPDRRRPPRRDALGRPRPHRRARAHRGPRRRSRPSGSPCCTRSSRCWRPAPPTSPRRSATPARRRWSGSSTAPACRCTGSATRCASTPATSTTSPTGSPASWRVARGLPVTSVVLDGEVLGVHEDATPQAFQDTMSAFGRDGASGAAARLLVRFFDILHRDGADLIDEPLDARLRHLDEVVGELAIPRVDTADAGGGAGARSTSRSATGHEGAMVKALDSAYDAGRRGGSWRKVKPVKTLDLVVLAAEWGSGRRQGWLSNLHLGARDPDGGFVMVGKTFKGLTDALLTWQTEAFLEIEDHRDGHTVFVRPELVVEIALDGVQTSTRYPGGVALRFARVKGYRPDKDPEDADLITTVQAMRAGA